MFHLHKKIKENNRDLLTMLLPYQVRIGNILMFQNSLPADNSSEMLYISKWKYMLKPN